MPLTAFNRTSMKCSPVIYKCTVIGSYEMANPLVCLFVTFGESHSRMLIDWATEDQHEGCNAAGSNEQGKELSVRLLRIILAVSSVPAQFPIQVDNFFHKSSKA